jgi:hypothetical protein
VISLRFPGAPFPANLVTLRALPVSASVAATALHFLIGSPGSVFHDAALELLMREAFPSIGWKERLVNPHREISRLSEDLQVQVVRALCPQMEVVHGLG